MRILSILLFLSIFNLTCKPITTLKKMASQDVNVEWWLNNQNKSVGYISMVHAGQSSFYKNVRDSIIKYKGNGYTIFYEGVKLKGQSFSSALSKEEIFQYLKYPEVKIRNLDTLTKLVYLFKLRRMVGLIPDSTSYSNLLQNLNLIKGAVSQPSWSTLGITKDDVNADISFEDIVNTYEKKYGRIQLAQIDFALQLNESLPNSLRLKPSKVHSVIIDYRDSQLAHYIEDSNFQKILVIYGADHKNGTFSFLRHLDSSWQKDVIH
jgi:hypothetical protein